MPQLQTHQQHRKGHTPRLEQFDEQIVGAAAELSGGDDKRHRRHAVAPEQPVEDQRVGERRIAQDFRVEDEPDQHGSCHSERQVTQDGEAQAAFHPAQGRQVERERHGQPGIL